MIPLAFSFLVVAAFYSIAGFGGGSSYIALLALFDAPYKIIPVIALICNLVVVSVGSLNYIRAGHFRWTLFLPFVITSVPTAYWGGKLNLPENIFYIMLFAGLAYSSIYLWIPTKSEQSMSISLNQPHVWFIGLPCGILMGGMAGLVGIGGGIFLAPLLHVLRWSNSKNIAATSSMFILFNSLAGLAGQFQKDIPMDSLLNYSLLPFVAMIGGISGSFYGSQKASLKGLRYVTAILTLYVTVRIGMKFF